MFEWLYRRKSRNSEVRWRRLARSVTRHTFLTWLSEKVAQDLIEQKPSSLEIDELVEAVNRCPSDDLQHRAERFIEVFYFDYPFYNAEYFKVIAEFRQMIGQHLARMHDAGAA